MLGFLMPREERLRGIFFILIAQVLFSMMAAFSRHLSTKYPIAEICFIRFLFGIIPVLPVIALQGGLTVFKTPQLFSHATRALVGMISLFIYLYSLTLLPMAEAFVISFTNPLCITLLSVWLLKEHVGKDLWIAVTIGFIGVLIAVQPSSLSLNMGVLVGFASVPFYSLAMIGVRALSRKDKPATLLLYFCLFSTLFSSIPAALHWVPPSMDDFLLLAICGVVAGCGQIFMTKAYQLAPPQVISPFIYTSIIWGASFGFLFWGEIPGLSLWIGAAIVIVSGLYIARREKILKAPLPTPPQ